MMSESTQLAAARRRAQRAWREMAGVDEAALEEARDRLRQLSGDERHHEGPPTFVRVAPDSPEAQALDALLDVERPARDAKVARPEMVVWALVAEWTDGADPGSDSQAAARAAIETGKAAADGDVDAHVDALARALLGWLRELRTALGWTGDAPPDVSQVDLPAPGVEPPLLWADAVLAVALDAVGPTGREAADALRKAARKRWKRQDVPVPLHFEPWRGRLLRLWPDWLHGCDRYAAALVAADMARIAERFRNDEAAERESRLLRAYPGARKWVPSVDKAQASLKRWASKRDALPSLLTRAAKCLWADQVSPASDKPRALTVRGVIAASGGVYAGIERPTAGIAWAFGGPGTEVDGARYAQVPGLAGHVIWAPRTASERPNPRLYERSFRLAIAPRPTGGAALAARGVLDALDAKALLLVVTGGPRGAVTTLGEVTQVLYPGTARLQQREFEAVAGALRRIDSILMLWPDDTCARAFSIRWPGAHVSARPEQVVAWGWGPFFADLAARSKANRLGGYFVIDLSGALGLPSKSPALLRHYTLAAARWSDCRDPATHRILDARIPLVPLDQWAKGTNSLRRQATDPAVEHGRQGTLARARSSREVLDDLEALRDEFALIRLEVHRRRDRQVRVLPSKAFLEADWQAQKGEMRPGVKVHEPGRQGARTGATRCTNRGDKERETP